MIRNLAVDELVIAGDCWDRGPRGDRVVDYLMQQPDVSFVWGNHDMAWFQRPVLVMRRSSATSCARFLALPPALATRGGIREFPSQPLEGCWRAPFITMILATCFIGKGKGMRETETIARMQKAVAIMEFKLSEGQMLARPPRVADVESRRAFAPASTTTAGTIEIDGVRYPLKGHPLPDHRSSRPVHADARRKELPTGAHQAVFPRQPGALAGTCAG